MRVGEESQKDNPGRLVICASIDRYAGNRMLSSVRMEGDLGTLGKFLDEHRYKKMIHMQIRKSHKAFGESINMNKIML